jgi:hypothetical protein
VDIWDKSYVSGVINKYEYNCFITSGEFRVARGLASISLEEIRTRAETTFALSDMVFWIPTDMAMSNGLAIIGVTYGRL